MDERFLRERVRHPLQLRRLVVSEARRVAPSMMRVTLTGETLAGFAAPGPADHVKVFFPDPETGELAVPTFAEDGVHRPEAGTVVSRDYTPLAFRPDGVEGPELDIDFVLHGAEGPASAWAAGAAAGDQLGIAGPRGSLLPPRDASSAVIVADETALPAAARWMAALAPTTPIVRMFSVPDPAMSAYLGEVAGLEATWISGPDRDAQLETALRRTQIDDGTFVFLAGEATAMAPLRRYLRRELELPKEQVDAHGYWKRGIRALDHHAPLDPGDPD